MGKFIFYTLGFGAVLWVVLMVSGALGYLGLLIVGILAISAVLAGLYVAYDNLTHRLSAMEEKLDALTEKGADQEKMKE